MSYNDDNQAIRDFVVSKLAKRKNLQKVNNTEDLITLGIIDSLGIMQLIDFIEQKFSIHVNDEEIIPMNFESIDSISNFVRKMI